MFMIKNIFCHEGNGGITQQPKIQQNLNHAVFKFSLQLRSSLQVGSSADADIAAGFYASERRKKISNIQP